VCDVGTETSDPEVEYSAPEDVDSLPISEVEADATALVLEQEQDPSLANCWIQAQAGKGGCLTHKGLGYPTDQVEGQAVSQFCVPYGRRAKILQLARESTLSDVQSCCTCSSRTRPVTTDRVPITPITRIDVPFQVVNMYRSSPSITAKIVGDVHECCVSHDKDAEFGRVVTPTPAFASVVVYSHGLEADQMAQLAPERRRDPVQALDDFADPFIDIPSQSDAAIHRSTATADFVPRPRRPCHVAYPAKPEACRPNQELRDRDFSRPSDNMRVKPTACVADEDGGGHIACDYRDRN